MEQAQGSTGTTFLGEVGAVLGTVEGAIAHPIATIEDIGGTVIDQMKSEASYVAKYAAKTEAAVVAEVEDLAAKVRQFFDSTSSGHLQDALLAMVDRIVSLEKTVADLRGFVGK